MPGKHGLDRVDDAHDVDPEGLLDVGGVQRVEPRRRAEAGVGDHHVGRPEPAFDLGDGRAERGAVADIGDRGDGRAAGRGDRRGRGFELARGGGRSGRRDALGPQPQRQRPADAARRPGDDRHRVFRRPNAFAS